MFAYTFEKENCPFSGQFLYPDILTALEYAKGPVYQKYLIGQEYRIVKDAKISADNAEIVSQGDATEVMQQFARRCAYRTLVTISGSEFAKRIPGISHWLNNGKITQGNWEYIRDWAVENEMTWMAGGHAEGAVCRAVLAYHDSELAYYHGWASGYHAKALFGKRIEIPRQKKSLTQYINKAILEYE